MKTINTTDDLIVALINLKGTTNVKIYLESDPKFNKKGRESKLTLEQKFPTVKTITKKSIITGKICFNYEKEKIEFFKKHPVAFAIEQNEPKTPREPWYNSVSMNGVLKAHKTTQDKYIYMLADEIQENKSKYLNEQNEEISKDLLTEFLPPYKEEEIKDLPIRLINLNNIVKLECNEFIYERETK